MRAAMGWDPAILRKYSTTGHFRLLNQLRNELRGNPLNRPKEGETVGDANRSKSLIRALEVRSQGGPGRYRRPLQNSTPRAAAPQPAEAGEAAGASTFRERLNAIDMR